MRAGILTEPGRERTRGERGWVVKARSVDAARWRATGPTAVKAMARARTGCEYCHAASSVEPHHLSVTMRGSALCLGCHPRD